MEQKETRKPRSYKATDSVYNAASKKAIYNNTTLAAEIEKYLKKYCSYNSKTKKQ